MPPNLSSYRKISEKYPQVKVINNYFPKFSPEELLATVGSCLGLWLGLGVIHIFDLFVTAAAQFFRRQFG